MDEDDRFVLYVMGMIMTFFLIVVCIAVFASPSYTPTKIDSITYCVNHLHGAGVDSNVAFEYCTKTYGTETGYGKTR